MNPEMKKLWIEALRSGNYSQGKYELRSKDSTYCCLGVLCELAVKSEIIPPPTTVPAYEGEYIIYLYEGCRGDLPNKVCDWSGLIGDLGRMIGKLMGMNDAESKTFPEIADWIEENL